MGFLTGRVVERLESLLTLVRTIGSSRESTYFHEENRYVRPMNGYLGKSFESQLRESAATQAR